MKNKVLPFCDKTLEWSIYLLIFCLPFAKAGVSIFTVLAVLAWIGKRIAGFRSDGFKGWIPSTPLNKALVAFVLMNIVSVVFSVDMGSSLSSFLTKTAKFLVIFFMVVETIHTERRVKRLLWTMLLSAFLIGSDAVVQFFHGVDFLKGYEFGERLRASFDSGNGFAAWLIIVSFLLLGWRADTRRKSRGLSVSLIVLVLFFIPCLALTYSRGGWLGFGIALLVMMAQVMIKASFSRRILYLSVVSGLVLAFVMLPQPIKAKINSVCKIKYQDNEVLTARMVSVWDMKRGSVPIRFNLWREAWDIIKDDPLTGCGLNTYSSTAPKYKVSEDGGIYAHNSYLQMAAETGLLGLSAFLWVVFSFFQMGLRYINRNQDYLVLGLLAGILGFLVHAFFDTHLYALQLVVLFWFMLGFTTAVVKLRAAALPAERL